MGRSPTTSNRARWRVQCDPDLLVVGIDPGEVTGAVVVLRTDSQGHPEILRAVSWKRLRRKAGAVWRLSSCLSDTVDTVDHYQTAIRSALPESCHAVAVEGLFVPRGPSKGLLALAEATGVALGAVRSEFRPEPLRPRYYDWASQVAALPRGTRRQDAEAWLWSCWKGRGHGPGPDWGVSDVAVSVPSSHEVDAVGLALYAAGAVVVDVD